MFEAQSKSSQWFIDGEGPILDGMKVVESILNERHVVLVPVKD